MMLATNKEIKSKEDVIKVARTYFSRWKIEEYFRCKKQVFQFENFRVRKLCAINALNFYITLCMAFWANLTILELHFAETQEENKVLFLNAMYDIVIPLTEILSVESADSFICLRKMLTVSSVRGIPSKLPD